MQRTSSETLKEQLRTARARTVRRLWLTCSLLISGWSLLALWAMH